MKSLIQILGILKTTLLVTITSSLLAYTNDGDLELKDQGKSIENVIEIYLSVNEFARVKKINGNKITLRNPQAIINGDSVTIKDMHTRGKSTLHYRRKSFSFSLGSKASFMHGERTTSMKKFNAISLSMDKFYFRNRFAFDLMEKIQLFGLFYTYCELKINGNSEGIYLILERPQDYAMNQQHSPLVIRRGYDQQIDKIKTGKETDKKEIKKYKDYYRLIYQSAKKMEGEELYHAISQWLDVEMYMKWLAFNFFIKNGDYTDEVYLCIAPEEDRFKIIPWDYDDIFATQPHEGKNQKYRTIGDKYIFSSEDRLDQAIANDPYLYNLYLEQLNNVLEQITDKMLQNVFKEIYAELYPYYANSDIIGMAKYDAYKNPDISGLEKVLQMIYNQLIISRSNYLNTLNK